MSQLEPLQQITDKRILIVGDVMLDVYRIASATRISPEAPVPVLLNPTVEYRLGGAGAVAAMCRALGAQVDLMGCVGFDLAGEHVRGLVGMLGIGDKILSTPAPRPTTSKERICGVASGRHRQQLGRIDTECTDPISSGTSMAMAELIRRKAAETDAPAAIIIADYAKGVCVDRVVQACRETGIPVYVDPPKHSDWQKYYGVECLVPNRDEAGFKSAYTISRNLQSQAVVTKLDEDGCELYYRYQGIKRFPARARAVHDVTGAGDQFIATLTCARVLGLGWESATQIANAAAGLQVERHGCVPVTLAELNTELIHAEHLYAIQNDPAGQTLAPAAP